MKFLGTTSPPYRAWRNRGIANIHNGAHYYGKEIEDFILPQIKADVFVVTAGGTLQPKKVPDNAVFVCHHNLKPQQVYKQFFERGILWVCSKPSTVEKLEAVGEKAVYIPLSIDTQYVEQFKTEKTRDIAFVGNFWKFKFRYLESLPLNVHQIGVLPRKRLLQEMAKYRRIIAEGRCNMEAQVLGCEVELPDYESLNLSVNLDAIPRKVLDNRDAVPLWREVLLEHEASVKRLNDDTIGS